MVAGVLSGTSVDGIDVALVRFPAVAVGAAVPGPEPIAFSTAAFPEPLGERVRDFVAGRPAVARGPRELALLHRDLGSAFGRAARRLAEQEGTGLDLIGSHGQTVWHHDGTDPAGSMTLQLGDGDHVAAAARCTVVSDFRTADVAAGGEGAPLSALVDGVLLPDLERPAAVLNLGGIANLTLLGDGEEAAAGSVRAYDVGPAGALLDGLARARLGRAFDEDGAVAGAGRPDEELIAHLLAHPFLLREPPKTTGRDTFGEAYLGTVLERGRTLSDADLLASAALAVARSILAALERWGASGKQASPRALVVAGGGVHHRPLLGHLRSGFPGRVRSTADLGLDPDAREALCFAVLAARCALGEPSTQPGATGAVAGRVLGKLSPWLALGGD